ncbi:MAG: DNA polymerase IV [Rhodospirillales bacterium]|jgi:DNA polymerase IV|nr:DNA polymerase IV [Rhodospirillales bacterium]MBT4041556.1 DNA polymerase IV [Rhodospirillales bacterium]MBT4627683.1 DNA polymerase IV [Rhodospirillales bacterium]MBT5351616.1 DNA polymerase IV [Rhodospirillales bacterium]MBT5519265.1 DNA polymerase IV [Rhodospirillales bacterium]
MHHLCRDCGKLWEPEAVGSAAGASCPICHSRRITSHTELVDLSIAHIDCDAFYASVEKRDNPDIRGKPVIVGGGKRGVVSAACYIARISGVRSAMPMFQALKRCPQAVVIPPDMKKYSAAGKQIRTLMEMVTPLVEPLSIDEAFLDLRGTESLHGTSPAQTLVNLVNRIEEEVGVTASIGLSYNKSLAKIASDLDKPRGFAIIGEDEALDFLEDKPVGLIWGVGKALRSSLEKDGISKIGELRRFSESELMRRYGAMGKRLHEFSHGRDIRGVDPISTPKNISTETTFNNDIEDVDVLARELWLLCDKLSTRLKKSATGGGTVTLKMKTADFKTVTRNRQLAVPTQLADDLYQTGRSLLEGVADGRKFRLIGIGVAKLVPASDADYADLADPDRARRVSVESAMDSLRERFGEKSVAKGRGLKPR